MTEVTTTKIAGITVTYDETQMDLKEVTGYVEDEKARWRPKEISEIELVVLGDEVAIKAVEKSPIKRVRRITGYLSNLENFGEAKKAEESQRYKHWLNNV